MTKVVARPQGSYSAQIPAGLCEVFSVFSPGIAIAWRYEFCQSRLKMNAVPKVISSAAELSLGESLLHFAGRKTFGTVLSDPPWRFINRTGKVAPEHHRLARYGTLSTEEIAALPVSQIASATSHLYLWVPNALLPDGLAVMKAWGYQYKSNIVWRKIRKDGGSDGRGVGFYFRNVTELVLFGVRGKNARTLQPGRTQVNYLESRKREHSRKPDEMYEIVEACSSGPRIELFARGTRKGWSVWGNQANEEYAPTWSTYSNHSRSNSNRELFDQG